MITIKVKKLRMDKGWTQRQLSVETGISKSNIDRIEKGTIRVTLEDICEIARALDVPAKDTYEYRYIEKNPQSG